MRLIVYQHDTGSSPVRRAKDREHPAQATGPSSREAGFDSLTVYQQGATMIIKRTPSEISKDLRTRAEIRRKLDRGHGKEDRIANLCDEAAEVIDELDDIVKTFGEVPL